MRACTHACRTWSSSASSMYRMKAELRHCPASRISASPQPDCRMSSHHCADINTCKPSRAMREYLGMTSSKVLGAVLLRLRYAKLAEQRSQPLPGMTRCHLQPRLVTIRQPPKEAVPESVHCARVNAAVTRAPSPEHSAALRPVFAPQQPDADKLALFPDQGLLICRRGLTRRAFTHRQRLPFKLHTPQGCNHTW